MVERMRVTGRLLVLSAAAAAFLFSAACLRVSALPVGFQEFYLPLPADLTQDVFGSIHAWGPPSELMHYVVGVTASADNTVVYYDHWEIGGLEGPGATGYDEVVHLDEGETHSFESSNIPSDLRGTATFYDGGDRIYVAGGLLQLVVSTWPEGVGTVFSDAWEVYPVQAWNTHYAVPVGEDLGGWPCFYDDFDRVYILVMSGTDGNTITIGDTTSSLDRGETLTYKVLEAGTSVTSTYPVQVQIVTGQPASTYEMRGYTITPRQYWGTSYYAPVPSWPATLTPYGDAPYTDLFLYNPNPARITVDWQDLSGSGSFHIDGGETRSFQASAGHYVPVGSGVHLSSSAEFWGVASCDTESWVWDWGYSLVPEGLLGTDNYISWAPGTRTLGDNGSPVYITATRDDTAIFIDYAPNNGVFDTVIPDLDRLQTIEVYDPDRDNTGMHIVSTAPVAIAWGESPMEAGIRDPYLDMGYTCLPLPTEWMDVALEVEKSTSPTEVSTGEAATFTITISVPSAADAVVTGIDLVDTLPPGWEYQAGSGSPSDPAISGNVDDGYILAWNGDWELDPGESQTIIFNASATSSADTDLPNRNTATATGQSLGAVLTADDDAFVDVTLAHSPVLLVTKTGPSAADVGETVTYTITVEHDPSSDNSDVGNVGVTDTIADSITYVSGDDGDGVLEYPEVWIYEATYTIPPGSPDPLVNTATAQGEDLDDEYVTDSHDHSLDVRFNPVLLVKKTGPILAYPGDTVTYTITVEHDPSSDGSDIGGVAVADELTGPPGYETGDDGDGILESGEVWIFTVDYIIPYDAPCPLVNIATGSGTDRDGDPVSDDDEHIMDPPRVDPPPSVPIFHAMAIPPAVIVLCLLSKRKR